MGVRKDTQGLNSLLMLRRSPEILNWLVLRWPSESTVPRLIPAGGDSFRQISYVQVESLVNGPHFKVIHGFISPYNDSLKGRIL